MKIEGAVSAKIEVLQAAKLPVTRSNVQNMARKARDHLKAKATSDAVRQKCDSFSVSESWVSGFCKRHQLPTVGQHREAGSSDAASVAQGMADVRAAIAEYEPSCVFSVGETGIFYRILPRPTYLASGEKRKTTRGVKGMAAEDRFTLYLCANASGVKVPLVAVGTSKKPPCFNLSNPPFKYIQQDYALPDVRTVNEWFSEFLSWIRSFTSKECLLLVDNHRSHPHLVDPNKQVKVVEYPPNCSSAHHPMHQGIIAALKKLYKTDLLFARVDSVECARMLRRQATALRRPRGMLGLAEGHPPHVLDAMELLAKVWDCIAPVTVKRCAKKAR